MSKRRWRGAAGTPLIMAALSVVLVGSAMAVSTETPLIQDVILRSTDSGEEVEILLDRKTQFAAFRLTDPHRIVVDLQGADLGDLQAERILNGRFVSHVIPHRFEAAGENLARLEIMLSQDVSYLVTPQGNDLLVKLSRIESSQESSSILEAADPAEEAAPADDMAEEMAAEDEEPVEESEPLTGYESAEAMRAAIIAAAQQAEAPPEDAGGPVLEGMRVFDIQPVEGYSGKPISLDFKDIDILDVFRLIAEVSGFNVVVDPKVSGRITIRLDEVPWDQALEVILKNQGLGKEIEGNIMRIASLEKLRDENILKEQMMAAKRKAEPLETRLIYLSYAEADDMRDLASRLLSARGYIITDNRTNALIMKDVRSSLDAMVQLIHTLDVRTKQVAINAKIITTAKEFARNMGIQWGGQFLADAQHGNTSGYRFPNNYDLDFTQDLSNGTHPDGSGYAVNLPAGNTLAALTFGNIMDTFQLNVALSASEREGITKLVSNPRIVTSDNESASLNSGTKIPYESSSASGTETTFVDATINLTVTPHVTNDEWISMSLTASKNAPDYSNSVKGGTPILVNEASTRVLIQDGDTLVIGGLNETTLGDSGSMIPFLHRIPVLGWLFKNRLRENKSQDLLIFVTPSILRAGEKLLVEEEF